MRNLRILHRGNLNPKSRTYPDLGVLTASFDVITDSITVVLGSKDADLIEVQQFLKDGSVKLLASFPVKLDDPLVSFAHFSDLSQLVCVFRSGDLITASYLNNLTGEDPDLTTVEIVGSIDAGVLCASWSPDEESLAHLTGEGNVVLLSRMFEPIAETKLLSEDLQMTRQVSLGWGKKETQFRGKGARANDRQRLALKHAGLNLDSETAVLHDPTVKEAVYGTMSPYDNAESSKITWRGDCKYFALNRVDRLPEDDHTMRRVVRVFSRDGKLESSSEPIDGMEGNLSWKPQGAHIASTQRNLETNALNVIFLERNGLQHGHFDTRLACRSEEAEVIDIDWSSNSEVMALQLKNSVQIWTTKNYHWYLKQELVTLNGEAVEFTRFHPENPLRIMVVTRTTVSVIDMAYCIISGPTALPYDVGMTLVTDGTTCMATPLARARVPPPACFREVDVDEVITDMAVSQSNELIAIITNENLYLAHLSLGKVVSPLEIVHKIPKSVFCDIDTDIPREVAIAGNSTVCIICDSHEAAGSVLVQIDISQADSLKVVSSQTSELSVVYVNADSSYQTITYETIDGSVRCLTDGNSLIGKFPQLCSNYAVAEVLNDVTGESQLVLFGITPAGKMFVGSRLLRSGVTSMLVTDSFLLYTTAQHELEFMHLKHNESLLDESKPLEVANFKAEMTTSTDEPIYDERVRMIERGSLLVSAVPSESSVTFQAPRGNLETVYPRIMVLSGVRNDIKNKRYRAAFMTCRTHRIALDILHDYDPELFFSNIEHFVDELGKVEYLDLFLSCLLDENVAETKYKETDANEKKEIVDAQMLEYQQQQQLTEGIKGITIHKKEPDISEKIQKICDAILRVLSTPKYKEDYLQSIITAYACQKPPKTEDALHLIGSLGDSSVIEKCVQHLCFLLDVNMLYNVALSIYDIPLALVVAQQSQKDPKEYLPFLQKLHVQTDERKRFMVDTHLKNYEKALDSLTEITPQQDEGIEKEISEYIVDRQLYKHALHIYRYSPDKFDHVLKSYADFLHSSQKYYEAALAFDKLGQHKSALDDYVMGKKWREALSIALRSEFKEQELDEVANKLVLMLTETHEYASAAYIEFKYLGDIEEALRLYCKDYEFEHAIMMCYEEEKMELIRDIVDPALGEQFGVIAELFADCSSQVHAQLKRLRELREKKQSDPFAFYNGNAENAENSDNVSVAATESTLRSSIFTRYTGKSSSTAKTGASRRTTKNRRREERKRARGKKGTIYEEEYLIRSTGRLVDRLNMNMEDTEKLVAGLVRRSMMEQAHQIQSSFIELLEFVKDHLEEIYHMSDKDRERIDDRGIMYLIPEFPVPKLKEFDNREILEY
ncbi:hypothetical protein FOA43_001343 [Brettanomyces nanus]|uniref:Elongator complex protein 1 n=1 Tax=Eeniella nana TaxID=13502 RepID=A0A875S420_EENNA|nr:uncharacterized protein FOA43_001343 [Brettanomyces nanus]QPG74024.1 hypothetical protein FOA43_001343 [Brettanomyces nanus]